LALASLISLERLFERDYEDGALDLIALGPAPLELAALAKALAQWITTQAPLALAAPVIMAALGAPWRLAAVTIAAGLLGGLGFAFLGGVGAALALGSRRGGVLIALIVLPLFTPPVIFGAGAIEAFAAGLDWRTPLLLLAAYGLAAVALCPFAMAAAARNALS
jgi:heme exporter protein B